ncbi:MAG: UbiD family decarboxylase [Desulfobacteraceae bacterium]|jgi:4-hydroxy-3-polyprenylbenzoate decarboxylase|nr:MAG: UbiD family decarboxylase [Desulfobacteraceae bacterium]
MGYRDLREWIEKLESEGELARIKKEVDWDLEIGGIARENMDREGPALLFENIKDHKDTLCRRLITCSLSTHARVALMLGLPKETPYKELIRVWRERTKDRVKPVIVDSGPCKENIVKGDDVDLYQFPAPHWQKLDGGRYIGTFHGVVTKDPDTGWTNVGMYREMIHDKNTTTMSVAQGQHIWFHWRKYRPQGKNMPLAVAIGWDQVLPAVAASPVPTGVDEYEIMGALRQAPVELVKCETSDLYVPASAEIILEGEVITDKSQFITCGPFGEFTGHYGPANLRPPFKVNCITFRNNPIFQGTMEGMPINEDHTICSVSHSAFVWDLLEERMTGITGVNNDPSTAYANLVVQINNSYYGQVHQVAANVWSSHLSNMMCKNIIVCDEDVDIYDLKKVFWALGYRVDPKTDIMQFPGWVSALDPVVHPDDKMGPGGNKGTRLLIDATKPIDRPRSDEYWGEKFAVVAYPDGETMKRVRERWGQYGISK